MTLLDILEWDGVHNQESLDLNEMIEYYNYLVEDGFKPLITNKTLFMLKVEDNVMHYHTMNAASKEEFISSMKDFLDGVKEAGYKAAYTDLENRKLRAFVKRYMGSSTSIVDDKAITFLN